MCASFARKAELHIDEKVIAAKLCINEWLHKQKFFTCEIDMETVSRVLVHINIIS